MQLPILLASQDRIADDPPGLRALCIFLGVLVAILPLAHVTALRNSLVGVVAALALLQFPIASWKNTPGLIPWLVWLAYAAASIAWSALPDASFQSFRSDQFYPFVIFLVCFQAVQLLGGRLAVAIGTAAGTLLCLATMFAAAALGAEPELAVPEPGFLGWLSWKASDATDASTYVAFIAVPLFLILVTSRHSWRRGAAAVWLLVFAAIGFLSENRTLVAALFVSFVGFVFVLGALRGRLQWKSALVVVGIGLVVSALCVEVISRARLPSSPTRAGSAAVALVMADTRPAIWATYVELARKRPGFGVGLGRTVPARIYHLEEDEALRRIDSQAVSHAHNLLLDLVLQVGLVGFTVWMAMHIAILRLAIRRARRGGDREKAWAAAAVALVLAMLVKNSTNDVLVYGNAILFWALLGTMLGLIWRRAPDAGDKKAGA
jgi:O-antigen ligase